MFKKILDVYRVLSLDVCIGVCCMSYYFSVLFKQRIEPVYFLIIFLAVFSIYSLDHIIDAFSIKKSASTIRHRFFQKNLISMTAITMILIAFDIFLSIKFLSTEIFEKGIMLSAVVLFYSLINFLSYRIRFKNYHKELIAGFIYAYGVMLPSLSTVTSSSFFIFIFFLQIFLIAYLNLIIFSFFDHGNDSSDGYSSIAILIGKTNTLRLIYILSFAEIMISVYTIMVIKTDLVVISIPLVMTLILLSIIYFRKFFSQNFRYRYAGDSIFFLPLMLLL